jgi:hypothetical protein
MDLYIMPDINVNQIRIKLYAKDPVNRMKEVFLVFVKTPENNWKLEAPAQLINDLEQFYPDTLTQ